MSMKFGLALRTDSEARSMAVVVNEMSAELQQSLANKNYGSGINHFYVGVIVLRQNNEKGAIFKAVKPKYRSSNEVGTGLGEKKVLNNILEYEVKLTQPQYESLVSGTKENAKVIVADALEDSLSVLEFIEKKKIDFDVKQFRSDFLEQLNCYRVQ